MKNILKLLVLLAAVALITGDLFAYGSRRSAGYILNMAKNATIGQADAAIYNPAGTTRLADGFYIDLTNQLAYKKYTSTLRTTFTEPDTGLNLPLDGIQSTDESPVFLNPSAVLMYKKGKGALWFDFTVPAGGGSVEYRTSKADTVKGLAFAPNYSSSAAFVNKFIGNSSTLAFTVGWAWRVTDWFSIGGGVMYLNGTGSVVAGLGSITLLNLSYRQDGLTGFAGINFYPIDALTISATYQPEVRLRGKVRVNRDASTLVSNAETATYLGYTIAALGVTYGGIGEETIDGKLYVGIGYDITEDINLQVALDYGFSRERRYCASPLNVAIYPTASLTEIVDLYNSCIINSRKRDGYTLTMGVDYQIGIVRPSLSFGYDKSPDTPASNRSTPWDPGLNAWLVSTGFAIEPVEWLEISLGVLKTFYQSHNTFYNPYGKLKFEKDVWVFGIGLTAKILTGTID